MKKIVALLLSVSMIAGIAAACKKSDSKDESTTETSSTGDSSIEVTSSETEASASEEPEGTKPADDPDAGTRATTEIADGN